MKIRQHIKIGATTTLVDDEEPVVVVPGLDAGHRAEWVEEMMIVSDVYMAQGDRAFNGPQGEVPGTWQRAVATAQGRTEQSRSLRR